MTSILVVVFNDAQVRAVLQGPDGVFAGAAPGSTAVIVSTIPTDTVLEMRAEGAAKGDRRRRLRRERWPRRFARRASSSA